MAEQGYENPGDKADQQGKQIHRDDGQQQHQQGDLFQVADVLPDEYLFPGKVAKEITEPFYKYQYDRYDDNGLSDHQELIEK